MPTLKQRWSERTYRIFHRQWPRPAHRAIWWLMALELAGLVPALVIYGISQPDLYRTKLWRIGFENKLNSNPNIILYAYANHKPLPHVALVWSRTLTDFNVAISVISLFVLLTKLIAFIMKWWYPLIALFANLALTILYLVSTYGQIGPDYTDERYPSPVAWYLRYGCEMAKPWNAYNSCRIAQGSLFVSLYMMVIYLLNFGFACWAMKPNKELNDVEDFDDDDSVSGHEIKNWEMHSMKSSVDIRGTPFTPRTQAFHALDNRPSSRYR